MSGQQLYDVWWHDDTSGEQAMEDNHQPHWKKVLESISEEMLEKAHILDFGCNQGGFLRYLYRQKPFAYGTGIDLAKKSIEVANARKGDLPLAYEAAPNLDAFHHLFDIAFSISVIYLIRDLTGHARQIRHALKPMGVYYCTYTDYIKNPSLLHIKKEIDRHGETAMQLHSLDDIAQSFFREGFGVEIKRLQPTGFIPLAPNDKWARCIGDRMQFEYQEAYIFRFSAPAD